MRCRSAIGCARSVISSRGPNDRRNENFAVSFCFSMRSQPVAHQYFKHDKSPRSKKEILNGDGPPASAVRRELCRCPSPLAHITVMDLGQTRPLAAWGAIQRLLATEKERALRCVRGAPYFGHVGAEVSKYGFSAEERRFVGSRGVKSNLFGESGAEWTLMIRSSL